MQRTSAEGLREKIEVEQVRSLFVNAMPASITLGAFTISVAVAWLDHPSRGLEVLGVLGWLSGALRLTLTLLMRDHAQTAALERRDAARLERAFAVPYVAFAALLGAFATLVFLRHSAQVHMLAICLVFGYCAGVAVNCALRPWLAIASMVLAVLPPILVAFFTHDAAHFAMALIASGFLFAGGQSVIVRHRASRLEIGQRLSAALLARHDTLTALPNRLALAEYFRESEQAAPQRLCALHYLDLDGFKQINDRHGHGVGDALLVEVAERLRASVRTGDIAARLGGDEFVVVQFGLGHHGEADVLARRIAAAIRAPFVIGELTLNISTSVGTAVSQQAAQGLEPLLIQADERLYAIKHQRKNAPYRLVPA
ncbi:GGDEF domain-containing protein [Novosphingobium sp. 1949]|uniref:GGDEF domain-containing protein n=1 Tax=Novosphingobium organovorum TaxID=2930092 RepID=A0ABT0B874_9SPHN|nr:GGDEF domain-containing protein [Novosphingobium organovorum]MCJ2181249.1 GGDEF domain-containing protein [Novosphingobium organovorum]